MPELSVFRRKVRISGPVESRDGELQLRIPLADGGKHLAKLAKGIGTIEGDELVVEILPWLAESLNLRQGSIVIADNEDGKFRITRSEVNDLAGT